MTSMNEFTVTEIGEVIESTDNYVQLLTMIYNELVVTNDNMDMLILTLMFTSGILAAVGVGICITFFIGQILKTR